MTDYTSDKVFVETCFLTLPEEKQVCNLTTNPERFQQLSGVDFAAQTIFPVDLQFHFTLQQRAFDEDLIFFIRQFYALYCPPSSWFCYKNKIRHFFNKPIKVFESDNGILVFDYIQRKLGRILGSMPYNQDPRFNPMTIYRGALKINKILNNGQRLVV